MTKTYETMTNIDASKISPRRSKTPNKCKAGAAFETPGTSKTYPLTAAQNMHYRWIKEYGTQQVSGLSVIASIKTDIDFELLEKCLKLEMERYGCMRIRFTKADKKGRIQQYLVNKDERDIPLKDLSGMTMEEADRTMQGWAYKTFDGDDIPMCEVFMMKLPEGFNGFFIHMDHRLIDSCGVFVMINDTMALYTHYKFGTDFPADLVDYEEILKQDLKKASNEKRVKRAKEFWEEMLDNWGEPLYSDIQGSAVLEKARKKHKNPGLRAADIEREQLFVAVKDYKLDAAPTNELFDFCLHNNLTITNLLLLGLRTYLSKQNGGQEDITIENFIARRTSRNDWMSGGSRTIMFPCRTVISGNTRFLDAAYEVQTMQNKVYMHSTYDPELIREEIRKRYKTPAHTTYESCYLTYQPMPVKLENPLLKDIPIHTKWFANGAATKKMYLTVSHTQDGGLNFSYHYQTADLTEKDVELLNYYLMRILFRGVEHPDMSVGEIMEAV
ncbi:condensation domain-containing protein [Butyrivibrio sp. VCD2006]|uniref:condensation domain-containing protein n=1 Tax=Butyrivibrio sp. VCD2006 TaxID=1280664 RepID=UPI0003FE7098|nr:condensation domain-containing protein [Butyrivibrio sp. VCD2006]